MAMNRRRFLRQSAGYGLVAPTVLWSWPSVVSAAEKTQDSFDDYKALVCVLFAGGMDSFNLLVPAGGTSEHSAYRRVRGEHEEGDDNSGLGYESKMLLKLDDPDSRFAVPNFASGIRDLFNDHSDLAFLANVGPLMSHMNREQFTDENRLKPLNLESHSDQIAQWQSAQSELPLPQQTEGWLGRLSDRFGATLRNGLSMNVTLSGTNLVQAGASLNPTLSLSTDDEAVERLDHHDWFSPKDSAYRDLTTRLPRYSNLIQQSYANRLSLELENATDLANLLRDGFDEFNTSFENEDGNESHFARSLKRVVQMVNAVENRTISAKRQTFFISYGGWDDHERLNSRFPGRIEDVSHSLKAFREALVETNLLDKVVLFTISDFGRTLTTNGDGSDHGWGGNSMILGGPVRGGRVYGQYPEMNLDDKPESQLANTDRGNFIPTTSLEEYFSELALWFGLDAVDLSLVLPNVGNFIPSGSDRPEKIGFLR